MLNPERPAERSWARLRPADPRLALAVLLMTLAWLGVFRGLLHIDFPLERFERSLHLMWLERIGDIGSRLGLGIVVAAFSATVVAIGMMRGRPVLRDAGLRALLAQVMAGGLAEALKFFIGRPRPRMLHGHDIQLGPTLTSGLESFPSGHASIAFAVATVFAARFPAVRWPAFVMAAFIAASRIIRGSHFPTDVMVGATLGMIIGRLVVHPVREWRRAVTGALLDLTPYCVVVFGILWTALTPADPRAAVVAPALGLGLLITGLIVRTGTQAWLSPIPWWIWQGLGVALMSGSAAVAALAWLALASLWARQSGVDSRGSASAVRLTMESVAMLLAAAALYAARGVLPILPSGH